MSSSLATALRSSALRLAIASVKRVPASIRFPLQRDGLQPVPRLEASRTRGDVVQLGRLFGTRLWLVTGYDVSRSVLADSEAFANDVRGLIGRQDRAPAERIGGLGMTDQPDHGRLRGVLTPYFTRRRLAELQGDIDRVVEAALDDMEAHGPEVDLVEHFGFAVPFGVICDLLGMPHVDRQEFRQHGAARFDLRDAGAGIFDTATGTRQFLIDLVASERRDPHLPDGLVSRMVADHGADFDDVELGGLSDGIFLGGYETSASMLSLGTYVLLQDPQSWKALQSGSTEEVDRVVEELLRFVCPVQVAFPRIARHEVEIGGARVRKGDIVVVSLTGAGRDPARHVEPQQFDPTTEAAGTLAFGHGLHRCVGAELARMELRTALVALARRFPDLSLACDPSELRFSELAIVHAVERLPVRLR
ncbi:cytochrome P450 [Nocardioides oleivorans]|uniref:Cytochrome P450 n=1 Tax=Nocardioides oleivorans TaxID=273676 RepID=A0A4Q2RZ20_9ACTN|nr:cytochrome P450 [Nocardioides oleivorans]RYB93305.1 cytochrome P450 [Nocardioides oleivorans]